MSRRDGITEEQVRARRAQRHESRTASTYKRFLQELSDATSLPHEQAERAGLVVVEALEQRIVGDEARHFAAQLPVKFKEQLGGVEGARPQRKLGRDELFTRLAKALAIEGRDVEDVISGVFSVLAGWISEGEVVKVVHGLPKDLRELWPQRIEFAVEARHQREREAGRALRDALRGEAVAPKHPLPRAELTSLAERVLALPQGAQLGVLRLVLPRTLAELTEPAREGFLRDMMGEVRLAEQGEPSDALPEERQPAIQ